MSYVEMKNIYKRYTGGDENIIRDFNLTIDKGEFIVFVGPSGCGKSTTIRMVSGLESITEGELLIEGELMNNVHPKKRNIAMVFQSYALYPHMSVRKNISFGLENLRLPKNEIKQKVEWALEILELKKFENKKPRSLSGGQRQRVALGRAIVRNPKLFLMDEPLSNLDSKLRENMRNEIISLHRKLDATTIYVTHDQVEAMTMADRIVVLHGGDIQQVGTPVELYTKPKNLFVATFIGSPGMNIIDIEYNNGKVKMAEGIEFTIPEGLQKQIESNVEVTKLGIRPEHISITPISLETYKDTSFTSTIKHIEHLGTESHIKTIFGGKEILIVSKGHVNLNEGDKIEFALETQNMHLFDSEGSAIL